MSGRKLPPPTIDHLYSVKVDNISYHTSPNDLRRLFDRYGEIGDVHIPRDRRTRQSRGFGFMEENCAAQWLNMIGQLTRSTDLVHVRLHHAVVLVVEAQDRGAEVRFENVRQAGRDLAERQDIRKKSVLKRRYSFKQ
uniref:Serine/arginine-rich splicing factor 2 n=1 Tax=Acrobeloides nanus TaxID=290746 RepID=A0A914CTG4_9BILA